MHRSCDTVHAQWLQTHGQWHNMTDVRTHNSRMDSSMIFKLGGGGYHVTCHVLVWPLTKVKRSKVKVTKSRNVSAPRTLLLCNGWSYQLQTRQKFSLWGGNTWHTLSISRSV